MFKKLLVASAVLAASTSVALAANYKGDYKGEHAPAPCPVNVFAAGPYVGLSVGDRTNYSGTPTVFRGLDGILSLGYGTMLNPSFYLAGEIFGLGTLNVNDMTYTSGTTNVGAKSSWGYGLSIIPGYMITDYVMTYLRLGGIRTRFNDQNVNVNAWQVGLGGQTNIVQNWDLRAEYVYSRYNSVSGIGNTSANQANLGLVYKFL